MVVRQPKQSNVPTRPVPHQRRNAR
jgi:hypothetical protein